jgi:hypothetical protein
MATQHDHGHTPAAWTGSIICFVGFCVAGVFVVAGQPAGFWVGMAVTLLGGVVGGAMKIMGLGSKEPAYVRKSGAEAAQEQPRTPANA